MTTRPRLATDVNWINGLAAVALFAVMAYTFLTAGFERPFGFGEGSIVASLGYAMFGLLDLVPSGHGDTEGFLVAFLLIAVVLDAALDGALMLARREGEQGIPERATDGGLPVDGSTQGPDSTADETADGPAGTVDGPAGTVDGADATVDGGDD